VHRKHTLGRFELENDPIVDDDVSGKRADNLATIIRIERDLTLEWNSAVSPRDSLRSHPGLQPGSRAAYGGNRFVLPSTLSAFVAT
jgi:hypothetical protein